MKSNSDKTKERKSHSGYRQDNASSELLGVVKQVDLCVHVRTGFSLPPNPQTSVIVTSEMLASRKEW